MIKVKEDMTGWIMSEHGVPDSRLTILCQVDDYIKPSGKREAQWLCMCNCEEHNLINATGMNIRSGNTKSCGCLRKELAAATGQNKKKHNTYKLNLSDEHGLYGIGYCSNTNREFYFDMDDYDKIKDYCWSENINIDTRYSQLHAYDTCTKKLIRMHLLLGCKAYDHIDRNPLNNRRHNLRIATTTENARNHNKQKNNTSGFIGVSLDKNKNKWCAYIIISKQYIHLGFFVDKEDAIRTRLEAEAKYFGKFAPQQHLFEQYGITRQSELEVTDELQAI